MDVLIRPMKLEDISQVHEIDVQSFSLPWPERSFRYELTENQTSRLWVAEVGDPGSRAAPPGVPGAPGAASPAPGSASTRLISGTPSGR